MTTQKKKTRSKAKAAKKAVKALVAVSAARPAVKVLTGAGDYRPTRFARLAGRGDYAETIGRIGSGVGGVVDAGKKAWSGIKSLFGFGDYRTKGPRSNSLMHFIKNSQKQYDDNGNPIVSAASGPSEAAFNMGALSVQFAGKAPRLSHREFIGSVVVPESGTAFNTTVYRIQPGLQGNDVLFPWGSSVASCFKQYILHGMILEYHSTSSDFASASALGSVMMSTVYDSEATPLANQQAIDNNEYTTSDKPCNSFYHPIECASGQTPVSVRYVRKANSDTGTDSRFDDVGIFQLSTIGLSAPAGTVIGELWATYDLELLKAELPDIHAGTTAYGTGVNTTPADWQGEMTLSPQSSLPLTLAGSGVVQMPRGYNGNYAAVLMATCQASTSVASWTLLDPASVTIGSDITPLNLLPSASALSSVPFLATSNSAVLFGIFTFSTIAENTNDSDNQFRFTLGAGVSTSPDIRWTFMVMPLDNDVAPTSLSSVLASALTGRTRGRQAALEQLLHRLGIDGSQAAGSGLRRNSVDEEYVQAAAAASPVAYAAAAAHQPSTLRPQPFR